MAENKGFNPNDHLMQIGRGDAAKDYLPVQWRLVWFREQSPEGTIETEMTHLDMDRVMQEETKVWNNDKRRMEAVIKEAPGFVIFRATVTDGKGGRATATKSEKAASFPDFIEKCETGAIGRALAILGYGTQFAASELMEHHRIVDSPVERQDAPQTPRAMQPSNTSPVPQNTATTQPKALLDMLTKAKARVQAMGMIWQDVMRDALKEVVADEQLTVQRIATINGVITRYEQTVKQAS